MGISIEQAADSILRAGLLDDTALSQARDELHTSGQPPEGDRLLDHLRQSGRLTSWQAKQVRRGRSGELVLGRYVVLSRVGRGGMGAVYKAEHRKMKRLVAIKTIRKELATPEFITRFRREIEAAARLVHPNIVAAYDADECELGDFLVMEFVDGSDLRRLVEKTGPLSVTDAVSVLLQTAQAMSYSHRLGIVHRDIKPANLMRDINGVTKVSDLGLARVIEPGGRSDAGSGLTEAGIVAGTVDFMPPEQAQDASTVDHRADIYSLGCTFYFLMTGVPPFEGGTVVDRILKHREMDPPSLVGHVPGTTAELDLVFQRMLAKSRDERFQSMDELIAAMDAVNSSPGDCIEVDVTPMARETTALIVESSRLQAGMITRLLNSLEIDDVHVVSGGAEAFSRLETLPVHLVLTSAELPDSSGLELAEQIRNEIRWAQVPVLIMTASPPADSVQAAVGALRATDLIHKPFNATQLQAAIDRLFSAEPSKPEKVAAFAQQRVLIVDDSLVAQRHIEQTLSELGFCEFGKAGDGIDGMSRLKEERFDLVITDYNMPNMDGREFVSWIRSQSPQRSVPIIMVTTEFDPDRLAAVYELGVSAICGKSFELDQVRNIVVRLFL